MKELRWYQTAAIKALYSYFESNSGNPLIVLCTGAGKSLVMAEFIKQVMTTWPNQRILVLSHVKELLAQNYAELLDQYPDANAGIYSAGLKRRDTEHGILFAGIQSVFKRAFELGWFDLILVDEAHSLPPEGEGQYRTFLADALRINPAVKVTGLTASPFRLKQGLLTEGKGAIFTDIAYDGMADMIRMIQEGYLTNIVTKATKTHYDFSAVKVRQGEYVAADLEAAMDQDDLTEKALDEVMKLGQDRKAWLLFCSGVRHAEHVTEALKARGITAALVTGETPQIERDTLLLDFKAGKLQAMVNVSVLTVGFNHPGIDLICLLRKTKSPGLFLQMVGRGLRVAPGKENCLVLDFAANILEHGPIDRIRPTTKKESDKKGEAPVKTCPQCSSILHISIMQCPDCGYEFPQPQLKLDVKPTTAAILSNQIAPLFVTYRVTQVAYHRHRKVGKPDSLRVDYYEQYRRVASEWICIEHSGYPKEKAIKWWRARSEDKIPSDVGNALEYISVYGIKEPHSITVNMGGQFPDVVDYRWEAPPDNVVRLADYRK